MQPGCTHLSDMYDAERAKFMARNPGATDAEYEQSELIYALNRKWALNRDNTHKKVGKLPERRYKSNLDRADEARSKAKAQLGRNPATDDQT